LFLYQSIDPLLPVAPWRQKDTAGADVFSLEYRRDESYQPIGLWLTGRVDEYDNFTFRLMDTHVALVWDGNGYSWWLVESHPPYLLLVTQPNTIEPVIGCVNNDDLS
jgi:hypothetical protein